MKIITVTGYKGGVGKSTTAVNLGFGLALRGHKVLILDIDPQANTSTSLGVESDDRDMYNLMTGKEYNIHEIIKGKLSVIPSSENLLLVEGEIHNKIGREMILRGVLDKIKKDYDFILIDCPPNLGLLTVNALTAAYQVLIPVDAEYLPVTGLQSIMQMIQSIKDHLNTDLKIFGILITKFKGNLTLHKQSLEILKKKYGQLVLDVFIRENIRLAEAPLYSQSIFDYAAKSNGAVDYKMLSELISKTLK